MLLEACPSVGARRELELGYGYALVRLQRFSEARALYQKSFNETGQHIYLHQLGMVAREAGDYPEALRLFSLAQTLVSKDNLLARAANLYELGLVNSLLGYGEQAHGLAACLELSLRTSDLVMHGCSYRLLGDLYRRSDAAMSARFYRQAIGAFERAGDAIAAAEIHARLATLG